MNTETNTDTNTDTKTNNSAAEDAMMEKINKLPKQLIIIMKYIAALATKIKTNPSLEKYISPQLKLFANIINLKNIPILTSLKPKLTFMLTTYIFYIDELLKDHLDISLYAEKHEMLVYFNQKVDECIKTGICSELYEFFV